MESPKKSELISVEKKGVIAHACFKYAFFNFFFATIINIKGLDVYRSHFEKCVIETQKEDLKGGKRRRFP